MEPRAGSQVDDDEDEDKSETSRDWHGRPIASNPSYRQARGGAMTTIAATDVNRAWTVGDDPIGYIARPRQLPWAIAR